MSETTLRHDLDRFEGRLDHLEGRLDHLEGRLERIEKSLASLEKSFDAIRPLVGVAGSPHIAPPCQEIHARELSADELVRQNKAVADALRSSTAGSVKGPGLKDCQGSETGGQAIDSASIRHGFVGELLTPPVDRAARILTSGAPVPEDRNHEEINPASGQQRDYVVLTPEERAKGFVRPVRRSYVHVQCGHATTMSTDLAETYARDPKFYGGTFCSHCRAHFPLFDASTGVKIHNFMWEGATEPVGS
jgi:hypothetical protein